MANKKMLFDHVNVFIVLTVNSISHDAKAAETFGCMGQPHDLFYLFHIKIPTASVIIT